MTLIHKKESFTVIIEPITKLEYGDKGKAIEIEYSSYDSPFGKILCASTTKGICYLGFNSPNNIAFDDLQKRFPNAILLQNRNSLHEDSLIFFNQEGSDRTIKLHLRGTEFQHKVWKALLSISFGEIRSYGEIAEQIGKPEASRAVGTAIGKNPVSLLVPCHRVLQKSGKIGGYMWGGERKEKILDWESKYL